MPDDMSRPPAPQDPRIPRAEPAGEARPAVPSPPPGDAAPAAPAPTPPNGYGYPQPQSQPQRPAPEQPTVLIQQPVVPAPQPAPPYQPPAAPYRQPAYAPQPFAQQANEPDWQSLADRNESRSRRKRILVITAAVVGSVLVAGGIAVGAVTLKGGSTKTTAGPSVGPTATSVATASASSSPSAGASASHAPALHANAVLNHQSLTIDGQTFVRKATETTNPCWKGTEGGLGGLLKSEVCTQVLRATYVSDKSAVTVGIAVLHTAAEAKAVDAAFQGTVEPLYGSGISATFCKDPASCAITHAVHGRYLYLTIAGQATGTPAKGSAPTATSVAAGHGVAGYALSAVLPLDQSDD